MSNAWKKQPTIGILGGGQLGRMFIEEASRYDVHISVLDPQVNASCSDIASDFVVGDFNDYDTVMQWAADKDIITIEIEHVNLQALYDLEKMGKKVFPQPHVLSTIKDKGLQKLFYQENGIPTAPFVLVDNKDEVVNQKSFFPCMQKLRTGGYDGKGVQSLQNDQEIDKAFDAPSVLESWVDFECELAVMVARNESGQVVTFPAVDMEFNPVANLVEFLYSPSALSKSILEKAESLAIRLAEQFQVVGVLAVEMFVLKNGEVLVNEVAPRPHNSGHHTIECCITSQYEQHLRAILNWPLGSTAILQPAVMINLLGDKDCQGSAVYQGMETVLKESGIYVHLYGKEKTSPFRKMGHVTVMDKDIEVAKEKARWVMKTLRVVSE